MSIMKYFNTAFIILILLISISDIEAGQVYTWTDEKGNLHITDSPPPADAKIQDVVTVRKQPAAEEEKEQLRQEQEQAEDINEKQQKEIEKAKFEARQADKRAQEAVAQAEEITRNAEAYVRRLGSTKEKRKQFRKKIQRPQPKPPSNKPARPQKKFKNLNKKQPQQLKPQQLRKPQQTSGSRRNKKQVSVFRFQVSAKFRNCEFRNLRIEGVLSF